MLRTLRIIGIVVFALLVGTSANSLRELHETGTLFEQYNSARKTNVTLLAFSLFSVGVLGYFELSRVRRVANRQRYGRSSRDAEEEEVVSGLDTASIYAAPETLDGWQGRRTRGSKSRHKEPMEMVTVWMGLLRICCFILPVLYAALLVLSLMNADPENAVAWLIPTLFASLTLLSLVAASGLLAKKGWGMTLGYLLAICNLLVFPFGTALGLFLLMGLVGSTSLFATTSREHRRKSSHKTAKKMQASVL